jgi:hypothetical protein
MAGLVTTRAVRDFDFHPDEDDVRVFVTGPGGVLRLGDDVLVLADGVTYRVCDLEEFRQARGRGLILPGEARGAQRGLAELTGIIERGELAAFLRQTCPVGPLNPPMASPADRTPLTHVPLLSEENRAAWAEREDLSEMP